MVVAIGTEVTVGAKATACVSTVRPVVTSKAVAPMVWSVNAVPAMMPAMIPSRVVNRTNSDAVSVFENRVYSGRKQLSLTLVRVGAVGPRIRRQGNGENENLFSNGLFHRVLPLSRDV